jgi:DNA-binding CsgD family transcriptional regulator
MVQTFLTYNIRITSREFEVLCLWLFGETAKESSRWLSISQRTIEYHRKNIRHKFQVFNFSELKNTIRKWDLADCCYQEAKELISAKQREFV